MNPRALLIAASLSGMLAVILGAFGAHALKTRLSPEALSSFEVAVRYQFIHTIAIFAAVWMAERFCIRLPIFAGWYFIAGILLFSGSIYLLTTRSLLGIEGWRWLGPVTPIGGLCFIQGWVMLLITALRAQ